MNKKEILKAKAQILNQLMNNKKIRKETVDAIQEEKKEVLDERLKKTR